MKIYTRRGDAGQTDLFGGDRVGKDAIRVGAYGDVDETNAAIGVAVAAGIDADLEAPLAKIQSALFDLGASLATPDPGHREKAGVAGVAAAEVLALEVLIDRLEAGLEKLTAPMVHASLRALVRSRRFESVFFTQFAGIAPIKSIKRLINRGFFNLPPKWVSGILTVRCQAKTGDWLSHCFSLETCRWHEICVKS